MFKFIALSSIDYWLVYNVYKSVVGSDLRYRLLQLVTLIGGGYFHQNRMWMCLPDLEKLTFSIPIFCLISHPSVYHFQKKSTQFWPNWMFFFFFNNLPKIHPIYVTWAPSSLMKTPNHYTKFHTKKIAPKGRHIYVYHVKVRTPPRDFNLSLTIIYDQYTILFFFFLNEMCYFLLVYF